MWTLLGQNLLWGARLMGVELSVVRGNSGMWSSESCAVGGVVVVGFRRRSSLQTVDEDLTPVGYGFQQPFVARTADVTSSASTPSGASPAGLKHSISVKFCYHLGNAAAS